ncbi:MAG: site-2 protease family protein [Candidatus ainarchaeum sp.]|nr:site-2 protease family protein [Candidatus ainarchaeum sp.]
MSGEEFWDDNSNSYIKVNKSKKKGFWNFSKQEKIDLIISWFTLSIAFTWLIQNRILGIPELGFNTAISIAIPVGFIAVGTGFVLHELAHRQAARHFGFVSEYRAWYPMLGLAVLFAIFTGFIFAAPGATYFFGNNVSRKQNGIISASGPTINLIAGIILLGISFLFKDSLISIILLFTSTINFWFAFFNLLPIWVLDGKKVLYWKPEVWIILFGIAVAFVFFI